ncbi:MAG TPA: hypothetical protein VNZ54_00525 [bacterium]|nr:hypothetical protein [bacterium]
MSREKTESSIPVVRGKVDTLVLYEVREDELDVFEKGSPSSIYFSLGLFFISVGLSFLITLQTIDIPEGKKYTTFLVVTICGLAIGSVLLFLWWKTGDSSKDLCKKIRARVETERTTSKNPDTTD